MQSYGGIGDCNGVLDAQLLRKCRFEFLRHGAHGEPAPVQHIQHRFFFFFPVIQIC